MQLCVNNILIIHSMKDVPFDLKHLRFIVYKNKMDGASKFRDNLIQGNT